MRRMKRMSKPSCFGHALMAPCTCLTCDWAKECTEEQNNLRTKQINPRLFGVRVGKDQYYIDIALMVSRRSTCLKRHYGVVIGKDDRIVATGYNGSPRGDASCCDTGKCQRPNAARYTNYEGCPAVHAEQNAMLYASAEQLKGATLYLACEAYDDEAPQYYMWHEDNQPMPCCICQKMITNSGITRVVNRLGNIINKVVQ
jgi:dCMP deaminase